MTTLALDNNLTTVIIIFKVEPQQQQKFIAAIKAFLANQELQQQAGRLFELAKEHLKPAMQQPGLVSATFHRSLDETRVINYGHWTDEKALAELTKQPGFVQKKPYGDGIAENEYHLYQIVHTVNA